MANVYSEVPTPAPNGSAVTFSTASAFLSGTLRVYLNGERQLAGSGNDYTVGSGAFTLASAPQTGDKLLVDYAT